MLLLQRRQCLLADLYLGQQRLALVFEGATGLLDARLALLLQLLSQLLDQRRQSLAEVWRGGRRGWLQAFQFFQIAVNGGFRAGIAQFDTYRIDTWMLATGQQRLPRLVH
ncbi:hypothetical protein D3C85_1221060 [compost metagenome]